MISIIIICVYPKIWDAPFTRHFKPHQQDRTLKERLKKKEEISSFFNWCLEGLKKFNATGLAVPKTIEEATNDYREQNDKIGNFIKECLVKSSNNTAAKDVYDSFSVWCLNNSYGRETKKGFL